MSFYSNKEKMECNDYKDICRNHSAKTDREMFRVCPSKLSKRELEDLYFTLLENNLDLKKTINGQQDKIRVLSTQVQRMTNTQERLVSKEVKDRGTATKAVVDEQKDFISELKETNQRLTDRIQQLNMRLCSAKQFMKTTPPQSAPFRGNRSAATAVSTPKKHDCLSKSPESSPEQVIKVSTFSQWEEKSPRKTNQTQNNVAVEKRPLKSDQPCDENKCRTLMEELKLRIATLQDELLNVHDEYATRISRLETEVMEVRKENIRVLSERSASELELTESCKRANKILAQYRSYEAKCAELKTELAIEKRKVAELETQLKAAKMSDKVNKTIEDHLTTKQETSGTPDGGPRRRGGGRQGVSSPDRKRDAGLPSGKFQDGGPRDGKPLNTDQPEGGLRDGKPLYAGSPYGGLRDGKPLNIGPPDGDLRDASPPGGKLQDGSARDGKPRYAGQPDGNLRDGKPLNAGSPYGGLRDGKPQNTGPPEGGLQDDGPQSGSPQDDIPLKCYCGCSPTPLTPAPPARVVDEKAPVKDGSPLKCNCGCPPPTSPTPPPTSPTPPPTSPSPPPSPTRAMDRKTPIKALPPPILPPKKRDGLDDTSLKSAPTKYSSTKTCSSASKYSSSYRSYTTTTSGDTNCETCDCKFPLMSAVPSPTYPVQVENYPKPGAIVNGKCVMCGYGPPPPTLPPPPPPPSPPPPPPPPLPPRPPENTSTPIKDKKNNVECRCPAWVQDGLSKLSSSQEANPKCMKCCYKDQLELELPPPKTDEGLAPSAGVSSLKGDPNSTSFNTGDDSGYQDTEQALIKQNKELMTKVLDLQRQVDCLKIGEFCGMPECQSESLNEVERIPTKTADKSAVTSAPPLVVEILKPTALPEEPDKPNSPVPKDMASTRPLLLKKPLQAEIPVEQIAQLPKGDNNEQIISIASDHNLDLTKKILRIEPLGNPEKTTSPPVQGRTSEDTRAKTIEGLDGTQYIADDALKVPDKYGYPDIPNNEYRDSRASPKFKIVEKKKLEGSAISIMPRSQDPLNISLKSVNLGPGFNPEKLKYLEAEGLTTETPRVSLTESIPSNPELGFGIPRLTTKPEQVRSKAENDSPSTSNPTVPTPYDSVVPRTRGKLTLHATHSDTPEQTDDTLKDKEDCQYCDSCFFDKECTHTIQPTMNKLAPGMQKEHARIQIPGPSQSLDSGKKDKKINIISQLKNHKKDNQSAENLIVNSKIYAKKTSQTVGGPVTLPDVPLLEKREQSTNDYNYKGSEIDQKTLTHNKKDKSGKRRKGQQTDDGLSINSRIFAEKTCETADGPVTLPDVPLLEKAVQEGSKYGPAKDSDEGNAKQKNTDKSSQAPGYKAWQGDALYSRRSGTNCIHRGQQTQGPHVCRCVSQPDGGCSQKPRNKGTQVADTAENTSPKEKRRAPMSDRGTYTLESKPTATSPDNTDLEMSYLSDLPMEKDKKSPLKPRPLSPGEDKMTTSTSTSYGTSPPTDYSLSEGEMPAPTTKRRLSIPDRDRIYVNSTLAHKEETPPVQQMEAALQAITDELQRCKHLLHRHRPEHLATNSIVS